MAAAPRLLTVTLNAAIDKRYTLTSLHDGEVNRVATCVASAGGKGLNVSRVATALGANVTATGFLAGHAGQFVAEQLADDGIRAAFTSVPGETRTCINIYDEATGITTELLEPGVPVALSDEAQFFSTLGELLNTGNFDVVSVSGSAPQGVNADAYARIVSMVRQAGLPIIVDSSGDLLLNALGAEPTLVKPNASEAAALTGIVPDTDANAVLAGQQLMAQGAGSVLLSRGSQGAVLITPDGAWSAVPPRIVPVNTVGCGDAMVAAAGLALANGLTPPNLVQEAVAVATASSMAAGTGTVNLADLEKVRSLGLTITQLTAP